MKKKVISGTTPSGFEFIIDRDALDDWELFEDLANVDAGDAAAIIRVVNRLLEKDDVARLKEHCRSEKNGRVSTAQMMEELKEIFAAAGTQVKNS